MIITTYGSKAAVSSRAIDVAVVGDFGTAQLADRIPLLADLSDKEHGLYFAAAAQFVRALHELIAPLDAGHAAGSGLGSGA